MADTDHPSPITQIPMYLARETKNALRYEPNGEPPKKAPFEKSFYLSKDQFDEDAYPSSILIVVLPA